ncbi:hypothetical protein HMPREF0262_00383 [Clostridium sp. ATCC 29733]|nr:hypothetical protein HMPREF0262_00383 [Clostridium sp. ATCC 29733]
MGEIKKKSTAAMWKRLKTWHSLSNYLKKSPGLRQKSRLPTGRRLFLIDLISKILRFVRRGQIALAWSPKRDGLRAQKKGGFWV